MLLYGRPYAKTSYCAPNGHLGETLWQLVSDFSQYTLVRIQVIADGNLVQRLQSTPMLATMLLHQRAKKGAQPPQPTPLGTAEVDLSSLLLPRLFPQTCPCMPALTIVLTLS